MTGSKSRQVFLIWYTRSQMSLEWNGAYHKNSSGSPRTVRNEKARELPLGSSLCIRLSHCPSWRNEQRRSHADTYTYTNLPYQLETEGCIDIHTNRHLQLLLSVQDLWICEIQCSRKQASCKRFRIKNVRSRPLSSLLCAALLMFQAVCKYNKYNQSTQNKCVRISILNHTKICDIFCRIKGTTLFGNFAWRSPNNVVLFQLRWVES